MLVRRLTAAAALVAAVVAIQLTLAPFTPAPAGGPVPATTIDGHPVDHGKLALCLACVAVAFGAAALAFPGVTAAALGVRRTGRTG